MDIDYAGLDRARKDDGAFFERHPERERRLRRAWHCEYPGEPPAGFNVFAIIDRQDVECWPWQTFGAPITFETNRTDAEIREILAKLAVNPRAMLAQEK